MSATEAIAALRAEIMRSTSIDLSTMEDEKPWLALVSVAECAAEAKWWTDGVHGWTLSQGDLRPLWNAVDALLEVLAPADATVSAPTAGGVVDIGVTADAHGDDRSERVRVAVDGIHEALLGGHVGRAARLTTSLRNSLKPCPFCGGTPPHPHPGCFGQCPLDETPAEEMS